jgi:hypothetical protein
MEHIELHILEAFEEHRDEGVNALIAWKMIAFHHIWMKNMHLYHTFVRGWVGRWVGLGVGLGGAGGSGGSVGCGFVVGRREGCDDCDVLDERSSDDLRTC